MERSSRHIDQHRSVLVAAQEALETMSQLLYSAADSELAEIATQLDLLAAAAGGLRADTVLEVVRRGVTIELGQNTREWILEYCPSLRQAGAGQLGRFVDSVCRRTAIVAGVDDNDLDSGPMFDRESPVALIWARVRRGEVGAPLAVATLNEIDRLRPRLLPEAVPTVTEAMLTMGMGHGPTGMRDLRMRLLAEHGVSDEIEREQAPLTPHAYLSMPRVESGDLTTYRMGLTPEQATRLEAAIGDFSAPRPNAETGEKDLRSNQQRRVEALLEVCERSQRSEAEDKRGPARGDTTMFITVSLDTLRGGRGAGEVIHSAAGGTLLGSATLRRMCCDGDLIPMLLGTEGEILDVGMARRLFTRAQRRIVWERDRTCTFPGCDAPGAWTRVHHVRHWLDDGKTDISNAALLCQRHHTFVHKKRLWAEVRSAPDDHGRHVVWDLVPGSYDRYLIEHNLARGWCAA